MKPGQRIKWKYGKKLIAQMLHWDTKTNATMQSLISEYPSVPKGAEFVAYNIKEVYDIAYRILPGQEQE